MALLRFDGLSFAYPYDTRRTLQNVSFEMAEGEYLVLCGPSGCGKTTLLKQAKRELRPAGSREGQVLYQNTPVDMLDAEMAFTEIGYVQQNPEDQIVTDFVWTGKPRPSDEGHPKTGRRDGGVFRDGTVVPEEDERTIGRAEADAEPRVCDGDEPEAPHFR